MAPTRVQTPGRRDHTTKHKTFRPIWTELSARRRTASPVFIGPVECTSCRWVYGVPIRPFWPSLPYRCGARKWWCPCDAKPPRGPPPRRGGRGGMAAWDTGRRDQIQSPCSSPGEQRHVSAVAACRSEAAGIKKLLCRTDLALTDVMIGRDVAVFWSVCLELFF